jgi:hypothetical protein
MRPAVLAGLLGGPTLNLDMLAMSVNGLDPRITFSRAGNATVIDRNGVMVWAPANQYANSSMSSGWATTRLTRGTANVIPAPVGQSYELIEDTSATTTHYTFASSGTSLVGETYVLSVYAKALERTHLQLTNPSIAASGAVRFNLTTNVPTVQYGAGSLVDFSMYPVGNGWCRCWIAFTATSAGTINCQINMSNGTTDTYTGNGVSRVVISAPQVERYGLYTPKPYIETTIAAYYGPRFDHDLNTVDPLGLLIEEARTNYWLYTDDPSNIFWEAQGTPAPTKTTGVLDPFYTTTAVTYNTTGTSSGRVNSKTSVGIPTDSVITISMWIKANTAGNMSVGAILDGATTTYQLVPVTTAWTRVSTTFPKSTAAVNTVYILHTIGQTCGNLISICKPQVEIGGFATSLIPTYGTATPREADIASITMSGWWQSNWQGTFVAAYKSVALSFSTRVWSVRSDASNLMQQSDSAGNLVVAQIGSTAGGLQTIGSAAYTANTPYKTAVRFDGTTLSVAVNGAVESGASGGVPVGTPTTLALGNSSVGTSYLNGWISSLRYYPTALPDAQLQALTA